jgi:hypothetical protein
MENVREATSVTGTSGRVKNKIQYFNRGCGAKQKTFQKHFHPLLCSTATPIVLFFSLSVSAWRDCLPEA